MKDETPRYRCVVVPLDGSRLAEGIIPFTLDLTGPVGTQIVLLRVVSPVLREIDGAAALMMLDETGARKTRGRHYVADIAGDLLARVRVQTRVRSCAPVTDIGTPRRQRRPDRDDDARPEQAHPSAFRSVAEAALRGGPLVGVSRKRPRA